MNAVELTMIKSKFAISILLTTVAICMLLLAQYKHSKAVTNQVVPKDVSTTEKLISTKKIVTKDIENGWKTTAISNIQFDYPSSLTFTISGFDTNFASFALTPTSESKKPNLIFEINITRIKDNTVDLKADIESQNEALIKSNYVTSVTAPSKTTFGSITGYHYTQIINSFVSQVYTTRTEDIQLDVVTGLYEGRQTTEDKLLTKKILDSFRIVQ